MKIHIVDGYNVIFSIKELNVVLSKENGHEIARNELIRKCAENFKGEFIIVFDGRMGGTWEKKNNIIFTSQDNDADSVILDLVVKHVSQRFTVYVYTRDRSLQEKCKMRGATVEDPNKIFNRSPSPRNIRASREVRIDQNEKRPLKKYNWAKEFGLNGENDERI